MPQNNFFVEEVITGSNSILFDTNYGSVFYEKLSNTIHLGNREYLENFQRKTESIQYGPLFESETLKKLKNNKLESLILNVTERCNLACSYCVYSGIYENERRETTKNMEFEIAKKAIDSFVPKSKNPALISFYGGEPSCNMDLIFDSVDYAKRIYPNKIFAFSMTTNFCDISNYLEAIVERKIHLNISLDGEKEIHNHNRKFKGGGGLMIKS